MNSSSRRKSKRPPYTLHAYVAAQSVYLDKQDIARELGVWPSQLTHWLNRERRPSADTALRLSRQFNIDLESLLTLNQVEA